MIDPVTGWFEIAKYDNKIVISIADLVENTLDQYKSRLTKESNLLVTIS